jgi:hypothetical protein
MFFAHHVAVSAFRASRVRLPVELSPAARVYNARHPRPQPSSAGLSELVAAQAFVPNTFVPAAENSAKLNAVMAFARKVQLAKELLAARAQ